MKSMDNLPADGRLEILMPPISARRELHVHARPGGLYQGKVYLDGATLGWTGSFESVDEVAQAAADEYGAGLALKVWSQDDAIILF